MLGDAGPLGVAGALLWGLLLALTERRARRPRAFLGGASLGVLTALMLPLVPHLRGLLTGPEWIPFILIYVLYAYGGIVPLVVTPVVTYLWFARTGRIR